MRNGKKSELVKKAAWMAHIIRSGLAMVIPILFIGSITVLLNGFPVMGYQEFLNSFLGGALRSIIIMIQNATVGSLAIYITVALNFSYMKQTDPNHRLVFGFGSLLGCLTGFFILVGIFTGEPNLSLLSGQGVFSAMLAGLIGPALFIRFEKYFVSEKMVFVDGADSEFNAALHIIMPFLCVTLCFASVNYLITACFHVQSMQHLFARAMEMVFSHLHRSYASGLLFNALTASLWWFGIHGNNVLDQVAEDMFATIVPGQIVSKSFIDTFVNMGGTGCTIGLLVAMILFGKKKSTKKLTGMAALPGVFNIGEMLVFGFPVIYNPLMILPFILSPLICYSNAYLLTKVGFIPPVGSEVAWTTPALLSGYIATGSIKGVLGQLLNILLSAAIYAPFVIISEKRADSIFSAELNALVDILKKSEELAQDVVLTECEGNTGRFAKHLSVELEAALKASRADMSVAIAQNPLHIKYQPQFDNTGKCIGAEALLRWEHSVYGTMYPPLVIELAKESGDLFDLETYIIEKAIRDSESMREAYGEAFKLSVNTTVSTLYDKRYVPFLQTMADEHRLRRGNICIEITEESELVISQRTGDLMKNIKMLGYTFALDDFSMGHTSLQYLQHGQFDLVKLDGNLTASLLENDRTKEIINSIVYLSRSLNFRVLAEFVETEEQREALEEIGCLLYQGHLFSPAVDRDTLVGMAHSIERK